MTTNSGTAIAEDFLSTQVQLLEAGDTQKLSLRYAEDAVFVRFDVVARGRAEIKALFDGYLQEDPQVGEVVGVKITDDLVLYQASERLNGMLVWAVGTIYFENGLVKRQTAAFIDRPFEA